MTKTETPAFEEFLDHWYPIQVKQKDKVGRRDIDAYETAMERANRAKDFFVALDYSSDARRRSTACSARAASPSSL